MKISRSKSFLIVLAAFLMLGIPFKVMVLVEGFTEVRPVNAVPPVAGMIFGVWGSLACGIGNLISDLFGTFNATSVLGLIGNFIAAYIPYRLWYIYSAEQPNLHTNINILKYTLICFSAALSVSWLLGFGLYYLFGSWIESIYTYIFFNNFGFSIGLGMPLFIMLTSDDIKLEPFQGVKRYLLLRKDYPKKIIPIIYTLNMTAIMILVIVFHETPQDNILLTILSIVGIFGLIAICI